MRKSFVIFIYLALAVSTLLVFRQVRNFDFTNYDDNVYVTENPHVLSGVSANNVVWAFTAARMGNWLPLTELSLMFDCQLFGPDPGWMHTVNLFFHIVNTLLLFTVLRNITGCLWNSAFVAALFALHPMHVESVAWIIERKNVLSTFFLLLALAGYAGYVKNRGIFHYLLTILLFALGLLAKPMLVTLPFVLLLLDYWPLDRFGAAETNKASGTRALAYSLIIEKIPFFALSAVSSVITFFVQRSSGAVPDITAVPLISRLANAVLSYAQYMGKMFWPQNLAVFYPLSTEFPMWEVGLCVLLLVVISLFVIRFRQRHRYLLVGWFWFLGTLIPVIGLIQSGAQSMADRYTYIPYIGLFIMIAWGMPELLSKWAYRKITLTISAVTVLAALGISAYRQTSYWENSLTLFSHALAVTQKNYLAYNNLGVAYGNLGRYHEQIEASKQAISIRPDSAEAYNNLGAAYGELGRYQEEIEACKQSIKIKPDYVAAHYNLGNAYANLGHYQDAVDACKQAIKIKPDYAEAYNNLGAACGELRRYQEEVEACKQAIRIEPGYAEAYYNLGNAYGKLGRYQEEAEAFKQAVRIKPDYAKAHNNLGAAYGQLGRYQDAVDACKQAAKIKPDYAEAYNNLGVAYYNLGRYREAADAFKQAIRIKPNYVEAHYSLGVACLAIGDKGSALDECSILKTLDVEKADKLFDLIYKQN